MVTIPDGKEEVKMTQIPYVNKETGRKNSQQMWILNSFNQQWSCGVTALSE